LKPYYQDDWVTIYHGDCRLILPTLATVDLLLTDPPYGVGFQGRARNFEKIVGDDGSLDVNECLSQALKVLRRGRHVYIFGKFDLSGLNLCAFSELIWDKENFGLGDLTLPWGPSHENITFAVHEISKVNRDKGYGNLTARMRRGSVLRCLRPHSVGIKRHPTEKPLDILRQMIESSTVMGETVLDPFCGSGSTLEAAKLEARKAIGIEIEEKYCEIAARRMSQEVLL
jgi:DNA modification methylase